MEQYRYCAGKQLRCGYTTGSCAAAAAKAAAIYLLCKETPEVVSIQTPKGWVLELPVRRMEATTGAAIFAVRKDAGDDTDVTDGLEICVQLTLTPEAGIFIDGGEGVGRITRPGLEQPLGAAAINHTPRQMIAQEVQSVLEDRRYAGGASVLVFVPQGAQVASRTFNPRLGIVGGISILGTSGIVEPMSETALVDAIRVELEVLRAASAKPILMTPGNYGETFASDQLRLSMERSVLCSNFIGDTLDHAARLAFEGVLLVGHIGKLVKLAGGIFHTHSRIADARIEILAAHAALAGGGQPLIAQLFDCATTDAVLVLLKQENLLEPVLHSLVKKISEHLQHRAGKMPVGVVLFSNQQKIRIQDQGARALLQYF
ncbi:MAG: cobalamin biosynthesis protein CbiD [Anaerotruncus sp.]|nr:cobalamin biosynthesis protein CbiD [Anaerotruncus sp.]